MCASFSLQLQLSDAHILHRDVRILQQVFYGAHFPPTRPRRILSFLYICINKLCIYIMPTSDMVLYRYISLPFADTNLIL